MKDFLTLGKAAEQTSATWPDRVIRVVITYYCDEMNLVKPTVILRPTVLAFQSLKEMVAHNKDW